MRIAFSVLCLLFTVFVFSQEGPVKEKPKTYVKTAEQKAKEKARKAPITSYKIFTIARDTTFVDTSLTIQDEYEYNYLRRDNFGLLPFVNEGHTYNTLDFGVNEFKAYPEIGYKAKHFNYLEPSQIKYYSVATPLTELYFKTVMEQGQSLDAFITMNTSERFNFSLAYKGLRSLGKYINQLASTGNFRFTTNYHTTSKRYLVYAHLTSQDFSNQENGGITNVEDFVNKNEDFKERQRFEVYLTDAKSYIKGKRAFIDHTFRINPTQGSNNLYLTHQLNYEYKYFEYNQNTVASTIGTRTINHFGASYVPGGINDQLRYNRLYNKVGAIYENPLGRFQFFAEDFRYNYFYGTAYVLSGVAVPSLLTDKINSIGGQYDYQKGKWNATMLYSNSLTNQSLTNIDGKASYQLNDKNKLSVRYQNLNKLPDHLYNLHQSSFISYNWYNNFKNQKINSIQAEAQTQWGTAALQITNFNDFLYYSNDSANDSIQLVSPKQYNKSIQYLSVKVGKEFKFWKFALDNTVLYQKVAQDSLVLNVPDIVTRNTLYFSDYFFKRALYLQAGVTFNYFTKYYMNDYNPVITEFFVQNKKEIGDFAYCDFFINMRVRQTRIFVKAEHFNSAWAGRNEYFSAPNYPYRDFLVRFGLVWNFFQ